MSATLPIARRTETAWWCPFCDHSVYTPSGNVRGRPGDTCTNCGATEDGSGSAVQADPPTPCPTCRSFPKEENR